MTGPGLTPLISSIDDGYGDVVLDPNDAMGDKLIDETVLLQLQDASSYGWDRNRRIDYIVNTHLEWQSDAGSPGTWFSLPAGGIYIPPYAYSKDQDADGKRKIRVTVFGSAAGGGTAEWQVETSKGNYTGTTWTGATPTDDGWQPFERVTGAFDNTLDGIQAEVGLTGEWIHIGLKTSGSNYASITGCVIWEDEP